MATVEPTLFNRELSWLEFNQRVLDEALCREVPLLDRLKFLAITASNLDEFFMVRVGGLELMQAQRVVRPDASGMTPVQQLEEIRNRALRMAHDQYAFFRETLEPELAEAGIRRVQAGALDAGQSAHLDRVFEEELFPVVTPMAVQTKGFPLLVNLGLHLAVRLKPAKGGRRPRFAVVPIRKAMSRFVTIPDPRGYAYILVEDALRALIDRLFPGEPVMEAVPFRITRNADLSVREDFAADLLAEMEGVLNRRKESDCVRLEIDQRVSRALLDFLRRALKLTDNQVYEVPGPLDLGAIGALADMDGFEALKYPAWPPQASPELAPTRSLFQELSRRDLLLCHPYDSFEPVVRLLEDAAADPEVLAIKQILYRTSANSPIVAALKRAAEQGKYVTVIVELKARFDESQNIEWAKHLEQAGVQVIYGVKGLKTHAKLCIIVRREPQGVARYLHFGTGNYNEKTARLYTDISYMTRDEALGADASAFFNAISGYSEPQNFLKLAAAPIGLRETLQDLIEDETERKRQGQKALIMAKMNSLVDPDLIDALYKASRQGIQILLNVRGICCLRPGVPGMSDTISVVSIVDRFLEHSRIFYFHHGGQEKLFLSSADWMPRNLDRRVELLVPVDDPTCRRRLTAILETHFKDTAKAKALTSDGRYEPIRPLGRRRALRCQAFFHEQACRAIAEARQAKPTVFEPHLPPTERHERSR